MELFSQGMKGPSRPAPAVPGFHVNRYSPVSNWNDDPFGADVFEPMPKCSQKKKPPPRPPPPKVNSKTHPDILPKPSHFVRRPTVLTSLLTRKNKTSTNQTVSSTHITSHHQSSFTYLTTDNDPSRLFPKCEPKNVQTGALIDLGSPPSSPTFTTRSSSDGLSVDSFGSDATTSTNHQHTFNGGSASQAESGFEDDFDLFLHSRKKINREDTVDDFNSLDPFSPQLNVNKPPLMKKPVRNKDYVDLLSNGKTTQQPLSYSQKGPTIIRAKPARPKPPDSASILKSSLGNNITFPYMNVNTTTPIQKMSNSYGENFGLKSLSWDEDSSPERESSPPMPSMPPPPPPQEEDTNLVPLWGKTMNIADTPPSRHPSIYSEDPDAEEPYAIALYDYCTDHPEDLSFTVNTRIKLLRRENEEWLYGCLRSGAQGLFPSNFVEVKVPLLNEGTPPPPILGTATVLYDFEPSQPGDLKLDTGGTVSVMYKLNDEWYFGKSSGMKGQFPANYVQMH